MWRGSRPGTMNKASMRMSSPSRAQRGASRWAATATRRSRYSSSAQAAASTVHLCLTSTNASVRPRRATKSTSPPATRTRLARMFQPCRRSHQAAIVSALRPRFSASWRFSWMPQARALGHKRACEERRAWPRRRRLRATGSWWPARIVTPGRVHRRWPLPARVEAR